MTVTLFIPRFADLLHPRVGISMVQILDKLGHEIEYAEEVACCGQLACNSGYGDEIRAVVLPVVTRLKDADVVVIALGSGGAVRKVYYSQLFAGTEYESAARTPSSKCCEFSDSHLTRLRMTDLGARLPAQVTFYDGGHSLRGQHIKKSPGPAARATSRLSWCLAHTAERN